MSVRFEPRDPDWETKVRRSFARQGIMRLLGAELSAITPGRVEISLPYREDLGQQHGFFHAGVSAAIADSACGYAAFSLFPPGTTVLTVEYKINLLAPADGERLRAVGTVIRPGRTLTVVEGDVFVRKGPQEIRCARTLSSVFCREGPDG